MNIGFFIAGLTLLGATGPRVPPRAIAASVVCCALFLISYIILAFQVLSLAVGRGVRVPGWIRAWTLLAGALILLFAIGLLRFLFP